jgi:bacteriorhodopsin
MLDNLFADSYRWVWLAVAVVVVLLVLEVVMRALTSRYATPQRGYTHRGNQ